MQGIQLFKPIYRKFLLLLVCGTTIFSMGCEKLLLDEDDDDPDPISSGNNNGNNSGNNNGNNNTGGGNGTAPQGFNGSHSGAYWKRNDGQTAYLYLSGSTAKACANNVETIGTFKNSKPYSMTYVIQGNSITFPLAFADNGSNLIVGVPDQALNTNVATPYIKTSTYTCNSTGGGGGGGTSAPKGELMIWSSMPLTGYGFNVKVQRSNVYNFSGFFSGRHTSEPSCGSSNAYNSSLDPGTYNVTVTGKKWNAQGSHYYTDGTWGFTAVITSNNCTKLEVR